MRGEEGRKGRKGGKPGGIWNRADGKEEKVEKQAGRRACVQAGGVRGEDGRRQAAGGRQAGSRWR